jgi:tRNA A37 threonylcarbamoyladenosine synthetase subunit TsaC/SUA5/YrdC
LTSDEDTRDMQADEVVLPGRRARRTDEAVTPGILAADVEAVLDTIEQGGVAITPTCLTYAIVGHRGPAVERVFTAKARSYDKPCGLFGSAELCRALHDLPHERHEIARVLAEEERLPFSIVAPARLDHPFLARLNDFAVRNASKNGTMDMVVSGGPFVAALAARSFARGIAVVGSSTNRSLHGSRYRLEDVEPVVKAAADLALDYGLSRWATPRGLSSTIIDFSNFSTVRVQRCRSIAMARAALNWTVRDLAEAAGLHRNTVTNIETGRYAGDPDSLAVIEKALKAAGVEFIDEIGGGSGVRLRKRTRPRT